MDVVCDQCRTEYEFDDALVSERGTTVKCTTCGHQFRIFRPKTDGTVSRPWILRRSDGKTATFDSLAVLQRWIGEAKASRGDLLSRDGVDWKPLGSIAELEGFFTQADAKSAKAATKPAFAGANTSPIGLASTVPASQAPPTPVASAAQPPPPPRRATTPGMPPAPPPPPPKSAVNSVPPMGAPPPASLPNIPAPSAAPSGLLGAPIATPNTDRSSAKFSMGGSENELTTEAYDFGGDVGSVDKWDGQGKPPKSKPAVGPPPISAPPPRNKPAQPEARPRTQSLDETVVKPKSRGAGLFIGAAVLAVVVGGSGALLKYGAFSTNRATQNTNTTRDAVTTAIDFAEETARAGTRGGYDEARERLTLLLMQPQQQNDPRLHAARGAILAARGEAIRQRADDGEARAQSNPSEAATLRAEAALLRGGASADLERARSDGAFAEANATQVSAADRPRFLAALGEIARVVRADLQAARRYATEAHGLGLNVDVLDGLIARDAGEIENALSALRRATAGSSPDARARLALARLYASRGDAASAHEQLSTLLQTRSTHDEAQPLMQAIDAHLAPFVAAVSSDSGTTVAQVSPPPEIRDTGVMVTANGNTNTNANTNSNTGAQTPTTPSTGNSSSSTGGNSGGFAGRSYDSLVEEGERQRGRGRMEPARSAFMAALQLRGDGCEAISGLASVEVSSGDERAAVLLFRRALSINSRYSDAHFGLGQAYERMGNTEGATTAYRQYLEVNPGGSRASAARTRLEAIERRNAGNNPSGSGSSPTPSGSPGNTPTATPPSEPAGNSGSTSPPIGAAPPTGGT